jgi:hypothetical protein
MYKCFCSGHTPLDSGESGHFAEPCKMKIELKYVADLRKDRPPLPVKEKNPCFGPSISQGYSGPGRVDAFH